MTSLRLGTVTAINAGPPPTVTLYLSGDAASTVDALAADTYSAIVGDTVRVLSDQGAHYVIGRAGRPGHVHHVAGSPSLSHNTTSFVTIGSTTAAASLVKERDDTDLRVDLRASMYTTVADTAFELAISIGGSDAALMDGLLNPASQREFMSCIRYLSGVAAGTYTIAMRARRVSGTGVLSMNTDDHLTFSVDEDPR